MIRARVDRERCEGYSQCNALAPELFELDDDGISTPLVGDVPPDLLDALRDAADHCPTQAILVLSDGADA
ncbi:MAG: putative ferredoxin [Frankiales bacterium]|nr:putative ferredoxin [Frankiales bacterium]